MKSLVEYIYEAFMEAPMGRTANEGMNNWNCRYIQKAALLKLIATALKNAKVTADAIQDEIGQYEDPDDLWNAVDNDELDAYAAFENNLRQLLSGESRYEQNIDNIMEFVFDNIYDLLEEV